MVLFPVIIALLVVFTMGVSYILTIAFAFFGDIQHLYSVLLTLWMYLSALFYPVDVLPNVVQRIILENPIYNYVASARECMMYGSFPTIDQWIRMVVWAAAVYGIGWLCFKTKQDKIIQKI